MTPSGIERSRPSVPRIAVAHVQDQRLLRVAMTAALLLHVGVLFVPLPSSAPPAPPEPTDFGPVIRRPILEPPEIEPPTAHEPVRGERLLPVPDPDAPDEMVEPTPEPIELPASEGAPLLDIEIPPAEAPPVSGPLPEDTRGLVLPRALPDRTRPVYPEVGRRSGLEGTVVLKAVIDEEGRVVSIRVVGEPRFDVGFTEAAIEAVGSWRYEPGRYGGEPVAVEITVVVDFVLN